MNNKLSLFKKPFFYVATVSIALLSVLSFAKEPTNLAVIDKQLIRYHDNGQYEKDIADSVNEAMRYLQMRISHPKFQGKPAIVLDIDETALSNYTNMVKLNFGGTLEEIRQYEDQGKDQVISPTLKLYRFAKEHQIAVFFVSGRYEYERDATVSNLKVAGYDHWDGLILRNAAQQKLSASDYKTTIRKQLNAQGYEIVLNMGDQKSDLLGGYADKSVKLPNPYYFIP